MARPLSSSVGFGCGAVWISRLIASILFLPDGLESLVQKILRRKPAPAKERVAE